MPGGQQQFELTSLQPILSPYSTSFETRIPPLACKNKAYIQAVAEHDVIIAMLFSEARSLVSITPFLRSALQLRLCIRNTRYTDQVGAISG